MQVLSLSLGSMVSRSALWLFQPNGAHSTPWTPQSAEQECNGMLHCGSMSAKLPPGVDGSSRSVISFWMDAFRASVCRIDAHLGS
jgi:hypothetical protein